MMTKFYTDPLQAAYMAREFGVKFQPRVIEKTMVMKDCHGIHNAGKVKEYMETRKTTYLSIVSNLIKHVDRKYYIHEDSLPIFKPKIGDLVRTKHNGICYEVDNFPTHHGQFIPVCPPSAKYYGRKDGRQAVFEGNIIIILRDNKQFFTPETEQS